MTANSDPLMGQCMATMAATERQLAFQGTLTEAIRASQDGISSPTHSMIISLSSRKHTDYVHCSARLIDELVQKVHSRASAMAAIPFTTERALRSVKKFEIRNPYEEEDEAPDGELACSLRHVDEGAS